MITNPLSEKNMKERIWQPARGVQKFKYQGSIEVQMINKSRFKQIKAHIIPKVGLLHNYIQQKFFNVKQKLMEQSKIGSRSIPSKNKIAKTGSRQKIELKFTLTLNLLNNGLSRTTKEKSYRSPVPPYSNILINKLSLATLLRQAKVQIG